MSDKAEIDVSEEAVERCAKRHDLALGQNNVAPMLRELRRQLSEKEAEVVMLTEIARRCAVGLEILSCNRDSHHVDPLALSEMATEAIAAKVKP